MDPAHLMPIGDGLSRTIGSLALLRHRRRDDDTHIPLTFSTRSWIWTHLTHPSRYPNPQPHRITTLSSIMRVLLQASRSLYQEPLPPSISWFFPSFLTKHITHTSQLSSSLGFNSALSPFYSLSTKVSPSPPISRLALLKA